MLVTCCRSPCPDTRTAVGIVCRRPRRYSITDHKIGGVIIFELAAIYAITDRHKLWSEVNNRSKSHLLPIFVYLIEYSLTHTHTHAHNELERNSWQYPRPALSTQGQYNKTSSSQRVSKGAAEYAHRATWPTDCCDGIMGIRSRATGSTSLPHIHRPDDDDVLITLILNTRTWYRYIIAPARRHWPIQCEYAFRSNVYVHTCRYIETDILCKWVVSVARKRVPSLWVTLFVICQEETGNCSEYS